MGGKWRREDRIKGKRGGKRGKRNEKHRKVINYFETLANKQRRDDKEGEGCERERERERHPALEHDMR